jgi:SpoVK/Ycf46/Vps4 family AAA+-type ATPase
MIRDYLKAGYPALCILTYEPYRAEQLLPCDGWRFFAWDCIQGIKDLESKKIIEEIRDPVEAVKWLKEYQDTVLLSHNLHLFMDIPEVVQSIQNGVPRWKATGSSLVMISPVIRMCPEVDKYFHVIDLPLPDENELFELQNELGKQTKIQTDLNAARAAMGLTEFEAETAYALSLIRSGRFSTRVISEAKSQMIRKSGLMEFWSPADINDVGGLGNLKAFISNRAKAFLPENFKLPHPKGLLLVGIPGTGKSLSSKATASILGWPLIRLDIGALKNSLVGESERRMREATQIIDAFGACVVWCDEIEKSLAGSKSSGETDAGTTASMLGHLLTWMQETTSPVFIMATANDISKLPPELIRRFDATFFVDLPCRSERVDIINIMNRKWGSEIPEEYADKLGGYTGAEIEQLAKDSLFDGLDEALDALIPLSRTMKEDVQALKEWAKTRARIANTANDEPEDQRKLRYLNP